MFSLIETLTGFAAIMLMLSLLVKTLTSVLKNYFDYYSDNLEHEVKRLVLATTGRAWDTILASAQTPQQVKDFANNIPWQRLGSEILNAGYLSWFLRQLDQNARVSDLDSRLKIHVANVNYAFEMRMKNLALAVGLGLCLLCNVNAFTIWKTLYTDQQLRATFATNYADKATSLAEKQATGKASGAPTNSQNQANQANPVNPPNGSTTSPNKAQLDAQMKDFQQDMKGFLSDVSFGVGRIWHEKCLRLTDPATQQCQKEMREQTATSRENLRQQRYQQSLAGAEKLKDPKAKEDAKKAADDQLAEEEKTDTTEANLELAKEQKETQSALAILAYEFFGSLLTGILVSIGAPYWHDILQALSSLRSMKPAAPEKAKT